VNCHKSVGITTNTSVLVQGLVSNFIAAGHGREAAFAAAVWKIAVWKIMPLWKKHGRTQECWLRLFYMLK